MRQVLGIVLIASILSPLSVQAAESCETAGDCTVRAAQCSEEGQCTLQQKRLLFPGLQLTEIPLREPLNLAIVSTRPSFQWNSVDGADLYALAIFKSIPRNEERLDRISNFEEVVWLWHSNLPGVGPDVTGIGYSDGRTIQASPAEKIDDNALQSNPPPLTDGNYYWAIWAWSGVELTARSEIRTFAVGLVDQSGESCGEYCEQVYPPALRCFYVSEDFDDSDYYIGGGHYCVVACASEVDCYGQGPCDLSTAQDPELGVGVCRINSPATKCPVGWELDSNLGFCYQPSSEDAKYQAGCGCSVPSRTWPGLPLTALLVTLL